MSIEWRTIKKLKNTGENNNYQKIDTEEITCLSIINNHDYCLIHSYTYKTMATSIQSNCVSFIHSLVFTFQQSKTSKHHIQQRVSVLMMFPFSFLSRSFFVSPLDTLLQPSSFVFCCRCSRFDCRLIVWRNFPTEKRKPKSY